jgi:ferric-dicitrate binding protein FerR (iron transport regulator)
LHAGRQINIPDDGAQPQWVSSGVVDSPGWLVLNNVSVAEAVAALNQFRALRITIDGAEVAAHRLTYSRIKIDAPESFFFHR